MSSPEPANAKRKWTVDEYVQLYTHVMMHGKTNWEAVVPGRTSNQARKAWPKLDDYIVKAIKERR